jgi:hypothetical protein
MLLGARVTWKKGLVNDHIRIDVHKREIQIHVLAEPVATRPWIEARPPAASSGFFSLAEMVDASHEHLTP